MIDILLPFYGDSLLMRECVASVLEQDDPAWRLIVVDDHSPDREIQDWLQKIADSRITYVRNPVNLGINGNFRRCLELAHAPYVTFLGCDDLLMPNYVACIRAASSRHNGPAMIQPRVRVIDDHGRPKTSIADAVKARLQPRSGRDQVLQGQGLAVSLLRGAWTYFPAIAWRRDAIAPHSFPPGLETALDLALLLDLVLEGRELVLLDEIAFAYRRHRRSASSRTAQDARRFAEERRVYAQVLPHLRTLGWTRGIRACQLHLTSRLHAISLLPRAINSRNGDVARALVRHAVR